MDVFQSIMALHKATVSQKGLNALKRQCPAPGKPGMILYKEALQRLSLNLEVDEPLMKEWIVRVDRDASAYTAIPSSIRSFS